MLLCFVVKSSYLIQEHHRHHQQPPYISQQLTKADVLACSHDRAQNDNRPYHFCAKNEYIDGRFLAGDCGSRQRQVADGADVVITDPHETRQTEGDNLSYMGTI